MNQPPLAFWSLSATDMLQQLHATQEGLIGAEARQRLARYGSNLLKRQKRSDVLSAETPLGQRTNVLWMRTHVASGNTMALVICTGKETEFGKVSERLKLGPQETDFEHGIRQFGYFLMEVTLVLVVTIFAINVYLARPVLDSFLFSLTLAVGLTPQLLPATNVLAPRSRDHAELYGCRQGFGANTHGSDDAPHRVSSPVRIGFLLTHLGTPVAVASTHPMEGGGCFLP
jgi:hypothetical protein